jgi:chemotaxis protein CheY-P-specific phosphatase CheC
MRRAKLDTRANGALSERAKSGFDELLKRALKNSLVPEGDSAEVVAIEQFPVKMKERKAVVLTISTYSFRAVVAFLFRQDADTRAHFERLNRAEPGSFSDQAFLDALAEAGNLCVGAMNRALGEHFEHIGMSTPNVVDRDALAYMDVLGKGYARNFELQGLALPMYASLQVVAYDNVDFSVSAEALADTADSGEMEMF